MTVDNIESLYPLKFIAEDIGVSLSQLQNWAGQKGRVKNNGFPDPAETLGRYHLYNIDEVREWYALWKRINANFAGGLSQKKHGM